MMPWWATLLIVAGTWASAIVAIFLHAHRLHVEAEEHREAFKMEMKREIAAVRELIGTEKTSLLDKMNEDHRAMAAHIGDFNRSVGQEYVRHQEFRASIKGLDDGITNARKDIGAVGNKVEEIGKRIDRLYEHYAWPPRRPE